MNIIPNYKRMKEANKNQESSNLYPFYMSGRKKKKDQTISRY